MTSKSATAPKTSYTPGANIVDEANDVTEERVKAVGAVLNETNREERMFEVGVEKGVPYPVHLLVHEYETGLFAPLDILLTRSEARGLGRLLMEASK